MNSGRKTKLYLTLTNICATLKFKKDLLTIVESIACCYSALVKKQEFIWKALNLPWIPLPLKS